VTSQYGETDLVSTVTLTDSMEGHEHEECRLQLEAQRISLSQIHAAQLELLKERLPEWEEPDRQGVAKVNQKLQQLDTGVLSSHTCVTLLSEDGNEAVCDDHSVRTEDGVHTSTLTVLQEEFQKSVKQNVQLQEEQHRQEIQHLRSYYTEQIREMKERYTNEILHLQDQLQDMTPTDVMHR
ncbi:A-kinase anchor protein 9 isoform X1, partial [Tachysurus ichikawai]